MEFTEKYFFEEVVRLRQFMGQKSWWAKPEIERERCISGLSLVYLNIVNEDGSHPSHEQIEKWAAIFESTIIEYERRKTMIEITIPMRRLFGTA